MIIRINGVKIPQTPRYDIMDFTPYVPKNKKEAKNMKKLATWLWGISGVMFTQSKALAAGNSTTIWQSIQPMWSVFQDIALTLGSIGVFCGLIVFLFKRNVGKQVVITSVLVAGGCFLVPAAMMLVAIIGHMLNDVLSDAFANMGLENSVKVGN
ncbi:hypothetical protein P4571_07855 [Niallia alba]|uniref:hypothetical protein n=1 Tax=Niallia alba TaxID=2729105 RepID=UPI002E2431B1|nr:hypothetical protein [Niallia alba]